MRTEQEIRERMETVDKKKQKADSMAMILVFQTEYDTLLWVLGES